MFVDEEFDGKKLETEEVEQPSTEKHENEKRVKTVNE